MESFDNLSKLIEDLKRDDPDVSSSTALYASAGEDTKVFTFTHPDFIAGQGVNGFPDIGLYILLMKTRVGKAMRAVKLDNEVASLQGINTNRMYLVVFATASALAAMAGGIIAPVFSIKPAMGHDVFLKCLLVLSVGGMESMLGGVIGGVVVGLITSFGMFYMGGLSEILLYGVIGLILVFKPYGLFGEAH